MWDIAQWWGSDLLITGPNVHAIELGSRGWFIKRSKQREGASHDNVWFDKRIAGYLLLFFDLVTAGIQFVVR